MQGRAQASHILPALSFQDIVEHGFFQNCLGRLSPLFILVRLPPLLCVSFNPVTLYSKYHLLSGTFHLVFV